MKPKKVRTVPEFPPRRNPPGHVPHVIDWDRVSEAIKQYAAENREMLIEACHGGYEGVDDGYYD